VAGIPDPASWPLPMVICSGRMSAVAPADGIGSVCSVPRAAPGWSATRELRRFWFPFDTPGARAQALVHAPAAFRKRGVFVADYEIDAA
jgi:hypothetical protein